MKTTITIDVTKLPKDRILERSYTNKAGENITVKEIRLDVVEMPEDKQKVLGTYSGAELIKVGFVCLNQTKEERKVKAQTVYVGDATRFVEIEGDQEKYTKVDRSAPPQIVDDPFNDEIPF